MNKFTPYLLVLVLLCIVNCESKILKTERISRKMDTKKMFSLERWDEWESSIQKSVLLQMKTCDSSSTYTKLNYFLNMESENLPFKLYALDKWGTPRKDILAYLSTSEKFSSIGPYTDIYIKYSMHSGEQVTYSMILTVINNEKTNYYTFKLISREQGGKRWRLDTIRTTGEAKLNELFSQLSCSTKNCEPINIQQGDLMISKFTESGIETKVIVKDCKNRLDQLKEIYSLANYN